MSTVCYYRITVYPHHVSLSLSSSNMTISQPSVGFEVQQRRQRMFITVRSSGEEDSTECVAHTRYKNEVTL